MAENWKQILESATSQGYRTNVVKPLMGMVIILSIASIYSFTKNAIVLGYIFVFLVLLCFVSFLWAYFYCLRNDPNLLRSEKYNLEKKTLDLIGEKGDVSQLGNRNSNFILSSSQSDEEEHE